MLSWADFWAGAALPGCVAGAMLLAGWRFGKRRHWPARQSRSWIGPLAVGAGFVAGYLALLGGSRFPPPEAIDWLLFLAAPLALVGLAESNLRMPLGVRWLAIAVVAPAALVVLAWPVLSAAPPESEAWPQTAAAIAVVGLSLAALSTLEVHVSGARLCGLWLAAAAPAAVVLLLSGSARLGHIGLVLAATAGGALAAYVLLGRAAVATGCVLVFGTLYCGLLWCGHLYAELTAGDAVLLAVAPNAAWLVQPWRRLDPLVQAVVQVLAVLAMAAVALVHAGLAFARDAG